MAKAIWRLLLTIQEDYDTLTDLEQLLSDADNQAAHNQHTARILEHLESHPPQSMMLPPHLPAPLATQSPTVEPLTLMKVDLAEMFSQQLPPQSSNRGNVLTNLLRNDNIELTTPRFIHLSLLQCHHLLLLHRQLHPFHSLNLPLPLLLLWPLQQFQAPPLTLPLCLLQMFNVPQELPKHLTI